MDGWCIFFNIPPEVLNYIKRTSTLLRRLSRTDASAVSPPSKSVSHTRIGPVFPPPPPTPRPPPTPLLLRGPQHPAAIPARPGMIMRHRNVKPLVSINEAACHRLERTLVVVLPSPAMGGRQSTAISALELKLTTQNRSGGTRLLLKAMRENVIKSGAHISMHGGTGFLPTSSGHGH